MAFARQVHDVGDVSQAASHCQFSEAGFSHGFDSAFFSGYSVLQNEEHEVL